MFRSRITTMLAAVFLFIATVQIAGNPAYAASTEPPTISDAVHQVTLSAGSFAPGEKEEITWRFNRRYVGQIRKIELWLGHSTGMGEGLNTRILGNIDPRCGRQSGGRSPDAEAAAPQLTC